ncbi:MAG: hypothetical protein PHD07_04040, partial [Bacteroidales bacterium]|nr:hypothetical protein [Bacteroidales bacterium]MDD3200474.1 hypothetical protein [Bacteroidales bacterium]
MKKNLIKVLFLAVATFALVSCDNPAKMAEAADQVKITCNPEVLEVIAGNIDAKVDVTFPAEYFHPKAVLQVVPVLIYNGGEVQGTPFVYQGEKVTENYKTVTKDGATISERVHFAYVPGMEKSELVARAKVVYKGKDFEFPADIKIADGANTTYMLVEASGEYEMMKDNYQETIPETVEAQILYLINSSTVRPSEVKSSDIKAFEQSLKDLAKDDRREVKGTEIVAYASPDGAVNLNDKLSANREKSAEKAFDKITKKLNAGEVSTKSIGEDWEGFQELVNNSTIEDKELIIRVLSMYSDPNVREREIKNMSAVYQSLAKNILPELRRARFITNVEYTNYTAEELTGLVENNIDVLDEEALLRAATLVKDNAAKLNIYNKAINKYNSDRAKYNAAVVKLNEGKNDEAKALLEKMEKQNCYYKNAMGVIAMRKGNNEEAANFFANSHRPQAKTNAAVLDILNGKYTDAAAKLEGTGTENEGLAMILTNQLDKASAAIKCKCPHASYQRAIIAARKGDAQTAKAEIEKAAKRADYAKRIETDVEFAKVR